MKTWILIASIVVGLLVVTSVVMAITNNSEDTEEEYSEQTCPNYNSCGQSNNCGRATCGAISSGSCGCGR